MTESVSEDRRREAFRQLVESQDGGLSVSQSREQIATQFNLTAREVLEIERAGIVAKWPPL